MPKLKVFRTPIGFHDAYVAAASQKAALLAWGADADLFARGIAERVDDPKLTKTPLAHPGEVIKVSRGGAADHFKVAEPKRQPTARPTRQAKTQPSSAPTKNATAATTARPKSTRPNRGALERAEAALASLDTDLDRKLGELLAQERMLKDKRAAVRTAHEAQRKKLEADLERARAAYRAKVERWASE